MGAPLPDDPCLERIDREPLAGGPARVVELLATGTNGGAQEHLFSLLTRMDRERYEVTVVSLSHGSSVRRLQRAGFDVRVIEEAEDSAAVESLARLLDELRPDVLHNHMYRAEVVGTRAALTLAEACGRRPWVISTVHSSRVRSLEDRERLRALTPFIDHMIAVSKAIERKIADEGRLGAPVSRIYNGVDLQRYDHLAACCTLHEEYSLPDGGPIVGVVARLEPEKGHPTLLEAWPTVLRAAPDARLLIVGEGSQRDALEAQAAALGIAGQVVFTGRRDDVPAVTAALDVAVLPSYREAQGLTILEAMALGRPVVASNVGGIPEMIEDGLTGLLVPPHDAGRARRGHRAAAAGPPVRRHAGPRRPRPGPRALLYRADGPGRRDALRRGRPRSPRRRAGRRLTIARPVPSGRCQDAPLWCMVELILPEGRSVMPEVRPAPSPDAEPIITQPLVAVVIPALNEAGKIGRVLDKLPRDGRFEAIVVDDGSSDGTGDEARAHGAAVVLRHEQRRGVGAAIRTGFECGVVRGRPWLALLSGDDQHEPAELVGALEEALDSGAEYVQGSRWLRGGRVDGDSGGRGFGTRIYSVAFSLLSLHRVTDATNGFRVFRSSILADPAVDLSQAWLDSYDLEPYLLYKAIRRGYRVIEHPVTVRYHRHEGFTKMRGLRDWWRLFRPALLLRLGVKH